MGVIAVALQRVKILPMVFSRRNKFRSFTEKKNRNILLISCF